LNDKLAGLMSLSALGTHPPTNAAIAVRDELVEAIDGQLNQLENVMSMDLADFNRQAAEAGLEAVRVTALQDPES